MRSKHLDLVFTQKRLHTVLFDELGISPSQQFAVAYSGGMDSTALLHCLAMICRDLRPNLNQSLVALHFNHHMSDQSSHWQKHCIDFCKTLNIPYLIGEYPHYSEPITTEGQAREARYQWFEQVLNEDQVLLTAHHQQDQAETLLLGLFQGGGTERMIGIPPTRRFGTNDRCQVARPLLGVCQSQLAQYLVHHELKWLDDPANVDVRHRRNFIRHKVLPLVSESWPNVDQDLAKSAHLLHQSKHQLDELLDHCLSQAVQPGNRTVFCLLEPLQWPFLLSFSVSIRISLIRRWIISSGIPVPSNGQLKAMFSQIEKNINSTNSYRTSWKNYELRYWQGKLCLLMKSEPERGKSEDQLTVKGNQFFDSLRIKFELGAESGLSQAEFADPTLRWRYRHGGEKITLPGRRHQTTLKNAYQQFSIPPWERNQIPFLVRGNEIIWVHGIGWCGSQVQNNRTELGLAPIVSTISNF